MGDNVLSFKSNAFLFLFLANVLTWFFGSLTLFFLFVFGFISTTLVYILFILTALIGGLLTYKSLERFTTSGSLMVLSDGFIPALTSFFVYAYLTLLQLLIEKVKALAAQIPKGLDIGVSGVLAIVDIFPKLFPDKFTLVALFFVLFNASYVFFILKEKKYNKLTLLWYILGIVVTLIFMFIGQFLVEGLLVNILNF